MIKIQDVMHLGGFRLQLVFSDGTRGTVDLKEYVHAQPWAAPIRDVERFSAAFVEHGALSWPGDIDVAPEALYALAHMLPSAKTFEQSQANELEMSLRELRRLAGMTQIELAAAADMQQSEVSKIERRDDLLLSTLRRYVQALGGELDIVARVGGKSIVLRGI